MIAKPKPKNRNKTNSKYKKKVVTASGSRYIKKNLVRLSDNKLCNSESLTRVKKTKSKRDEPKNTQTVDQYVLDMINNRGLVTTVVSNEMIEINTSCFGGDGDEIVWVLPTNISTSGVNRFVIQDISPDEIIIPSDDSIVNDMGRSKQKKTKTKNVCIDLTIKKKTKPKKVRTMGTTRKTMTKKPTLTLEKLSSNPTRSLIVKNKTKEELKTIFPVRNKNAHYVYIIHTRDSNSRIVFYTGYTIDLANRIRQHNGKIVGGATYTSRFKDWEFICFISGFTDIVIGKTTALQCEWKLKRNANVPENVIIRGKKYKTPQCKLYRKVSKINNHLNGVLFTSKSVKICDLSLTINWCNSVCYKYALGMNWPQSISNILFIP